MQTAYTLRRFRGTYLENIIRLSSRGKVSHFIISKIRNAYATPTYSNALFYHENYGESRVHTFMKKKKKKKLYFVSFT